MPQDLHVGQLAAWLSERRFVAVYAGWQSGKTVIGAHWLVREMQRRGAGDYAVIVPTYPILLNKALPELKVAFKGIGVWKGGEKYFEITPEGARKLGWPIGSIGRILVRHGESPDAIEAFTAKAIWIDEPGQLKDSVWTAIQPRGAVFEARFFFTSRPYSHNWYVREIWARVMGKDNKRRADADPDIEVINFRSIDNTSFSKKEYYRQKAIMPDWEFAMKYDGVPTRPAGAIWGCFINDPDVFETTGETNTCRSFVIPDDWPIEGGVDFGNNNTAALLKAAELIDGVDTLGRPARVPTGRHFFFAGYKKAGRTNEEHAWALRCAANQLTSSFEIAFSQWSKDPSRAMRDMGDPPPQVIANLLARCTRHLTLVGGSHQEQGWRDSYRLGGVTVIEPRDNNVEVQISCAFAGLKTLQAIFFADLVDEVAQIENYSRKLDDDQQPTKEIHEKGKQHWADAFRYIASKVWPPMKIEEGASSIPETKTNPIPSVPEKITAAGAVATSTGAFIPPPIQKPKRRF